MVNELKGKLEGDGSEDLYYMQSEKRISIMDDEKREDTNITVNT